MVRVARCKESPNGRLLASASLDHTVKLWNATNFRLLNTYRGHAARLNNIVFSSDGKFLVSGGLDGAIKVWNTAQRDLDNRLAFSPDLGETEPRQVAVPDRTKFP